ncbi:S8 family serine peptidase [Plantactinospora soyae]|uniref:Subtilisin family serine protease n=1 Tax=Plantactinospora soyae TaxID=1544732 RepID=A0A927MG59_9ACTN|nr:S8 family serine peptidase [Plantactinospora soyae]MBE1492431.1 subtilisin family serine protease [Plantactinospora soyae]
MRIRRRPVARLGLAVAVLTAGQLTAGGPGAASAAGQPATGGRAVHAVAAAPDRAAEASSAQPVRTVTLVTGDRITVYGADRSRWAVTRGPGREHVTFQGSRVGDQLRVVPSDAVGPLRDGLLDRRLFDVSTLLDSGYDDRRADLPLIVTYADDAAARTVRTAAPAGVRVLRSLPGPATFAVRAERRDAGGFWRSLGVTAGGFAPASGVRKVWLDGLRKPVLATSVPQIGAPAAWQAGYTGAGVTVAVLDTGIDGKHPDLAGRVVAAENFTEGVEDDRDLVGHGTHVASTVAGNGAASGGRNRGVAPDATLVNGKVCVDGGCMDSWILAGMQWAVTERQAKVVNLSLGGLDGPETDPLEQAVTELSARYGTLFVVAAGNFGADASVGSPASAPAALAVGAVDRSDALADFSSRGPAIGTAAVKPDLTAPGVDITAARGADGRFGSPGEPYATISGTSMATPHVAGAAALLAQQHPDWSGEQLKRTLMAAARRSTGTGVFGQGAGRVDLGRAMTQSVTTTPASVSFGLHQWPHGDDEPVVRTVTYHNGGSQPVQLALAVQADGPAGTPAPAGMFTLGASRLTVPAGGTAQTTVTADVRPGTQDGNYAGYLLASAGDLVVNTPVSVGREIESYDLTLVHTGRDGAPATDVQPGVLRIDGETTEIPVPANGRMRLPRGSYLVYTWIYGPDGDLTHLVWPRLELTGNQTVNLDARLGRPLQVTVPDPTAGQILAELISTIPTDDKLGAATLTFGESFDRTYSAQLGPADLRDGVWAKIGSQWARGGVDGMSDSPYGYRLAWYERGRLPTGFIRNVRPEDLAAVRHSYASSTPGMRGRFAAIAAADDLPGGGFLTDIGFAPPTTRTEYYSADTGLTWQNDFLEYSADQGDMLTSLWGVSRYRAGVTYRESWNRGVLGPAFFGLDIPDGEPKEVARVGDTIHTFLSLYSDAVDRFGLGQNADYTSTLHRNGALIGTADGWESSFEVPTAEAGYRLRYEAQRAAPATLATRTSVEWTFRSRGNGAANTPLPVSVVRFEPRLDEVNGAPAGATVRFPVTVFRQPGSAAGTVRTLGVDVSYDDGQTWQRAELGRSGDGGTLTLRHPASGGYVSLRARATDSAGNTTDQTIIRAYRLVKG